jgi:hypothetical protein
MVTMVDLAAGQGATELNTSALRIETPVDHGQTGQTNGHTLFADGEIGALLVIRLAVALKRNDSPDLPVFQKTINTRSVMRAVAAKGVDGEIRIQGSEFRQRNDAGNRVMPVGLNHAQIDRQVTLEIRIVNSKDIGGMAVEIAVMVTVPAVTGVGIGENTRAVTVIDTLFPAGTLFAAPGRTAGQDTGTIPGSDQFLRIAEQTLTDSGFCRYFGKDLLHEPLWSFFEDSVPGSQVSKFLNDAWSPYWLLFVFAVFLFRFAVEGMK